MENFILEYGILAIGFVLFIDDLGIPLPGATIIFSSAVLARHTSGIDVWSLFLVALLIPPIGNMILFYASRHGLRDWLDKHGHKVFLPKKRIDKAQKIFNKYGELTVFFAAMMSGIRAVSSVIAGGLKMNPLKFLFYHFLGVTIWASTVVSVGYFWGHEIVGILKTYWHIFLILLLIFILFKTFIFFKNNVQKNTRHR